MMKSLSLRIAAVVALQVLVLVFMIAKKQWTLNSGQVIELETAPVDPRSLFRGDYVRLRYAISTPNPTELEGDDTFARFDQIHVVVAPGERYWEPVSIHHRRPDVGPDQLVIKGEVNTFFGAGCETCLDVRYGIEDYFVPEGEGRGLERPKDGEVMSIRVAVDRFGNAGIKAVLINGEARYTESLF